MSEINEEELKKIAKVLIKLGEGSVAQLMLDRINNNDSSIKSLNSFCDAFVTAVLPHNLLQDISHAGQKLFIEIGLGQILKTSKKESPTINNTQMFMLVSEDKKYGVNPVRRYNNPADPAMAACRIDNNISSAKFIAALKGDMLDHLNSDQKLPEGMTLKLVRITEFETICSSDDETFNKTNH